MHDDTLDLMQSLIAGIASEQRSADRLENLAAALREQGQTGEAEALFALIRERRDWLRKMSQHFLELEQAYREVDCCGI